MTKRLAVIFATALLAACGLQQKPHQPIHAQPVEPTAATPAVVVPQPSQQPAKVVVAEKVVVVKQPEPVTCDMLSPPASVPLPVAPNVRPGVVITDKQKIALMQTYIQALQRHIKHQNETEIKTYQSYVSACATPKSPVPAATAPIPPAPASSLPPNIPGG